MTRWILVPRFAPTASSAQVDRWVESARRAAQVSPQVSFSDAGLDLPDSFGGGDATWDLTTSVPPEDIPAVAALLVADGRPLRSWDRVALDPVVRGFSALSGARIKRTLLLAVQPTAAESVVERFERSLAAMAEHIGEIASWSLSRVDRARSTVGWTHVWEQEFADLDGLRRGYLRSDYHLTAVDRWFDTEIPGAIAQPAVAHLVRSAAGAVLLPD